MLLKDLGVTKKQAKEIRFLCNETFGSENYYIHFKTSNSDIIETAFTGDQSHLSPLAFKSGINKLERPQGWDLYRNRLSKFQINSIDYANKSKTGGLANTPFGSTKFQTFWTVVGDDPRNPIYECGSYHRSILDSVGAKSPNMARTTHSIWFKGVPPTAEEVRKRMLTKINKRAYTG
jgi:hypothetical protein